MGNIEILSKYIQFMNICKSQLVVLLGNKKMTSILSGTFICISFPYFISIIPIFRQNYYRLHILLNRTKMINTQKTTTLKFYSMSLHSVCDMLQNMYSIE